MNTYIHTIEKEGTGIEKEGTGIEKEGTGIEKEGTGKRPLWLGLVMGLALNAQAMEQKPVQPANLLLSAQGETLQLSWHILDSQGNSHQLVGQKLAYGSEAMQLYELKMTDGYPALLPVARLKMPSGCGWQKAALSTAPTWSENWLVQLDTVDFELKTPEREGSGAPEREGSGVPEREGSGVPEREGSGVPEREGSGVPEREGSGAPEREGSGTPEQEGTGLPVQLWSGEEVEILINLQCGYQKGEPLGD